jgi:GTPase involved in cell partitioning and DNA repair
VQWRKDHGHVVGGAGGLGAASHAESCHNAPQLQREGRGGWERGRERGREGGKGGAHR